MSLRIADIIEALKYLSRPQLNLWIKLDIIEALESCIKDLSTEDMLDSVYGDYLFSKRRFRETVINYFSDEEIEIRCRLLGIPNTGRSQLESDLTKFSVFLRFQYRGWKIERKAKIQELGVVYGEYGKQLTSSGIPHEYQLSAKRELLQWYLSDVPSTLLFMPTGSGKTRTANELLVDIFRSRPAKCLWLTNRSELLVQASLSFAGLWKEKGDHGVVVKYFFDKSDEWFSKSSSYTEIVYSSFDKLHSRKNDVSYDFDFVIVDEAHYSLADTYMPLINQMIREGVKALGLTATPMSSNDDEFNSIRTFFGTSIDLSRLANGKYSFDYLQRNNFLANIEYSYLNIDRSNFHWTSPRLNSVIKDFVSDIESKRENVIIFAINKDHAILLVNLLKISGINSALIVGETPINQRSEYLKDFEEGRITALVNHEILSTGVDVPKLNSIMVLRDFGSDNIALQVVGRALRGKLNGGNVTNTVIFPNLDFKVDIKQKY